MAENKGMFETADSGGYPAERCQTPVETGGSLMAYPCWLPRGHAGPCASQENAKSQSIRQRWLDAQQPPAVPPSVQSEGVIAPGAEHSTPVDATGAIAARDTIPADGMDYEPQPTKQREGDQPLPRQPEDTSISMQDLVIAAIQERKEVGIQRYGTLLYASNGRDAVRDAAEEALDLLMYLTQVRIELDGARAEVTALWDALSQTIDTKEVSMGRLKIMLDTVGRVRSVIDPGWTPESG